MQWTYVKERLLMGYLTLERPQRSNDRNRNFDRPYFQNYCTEVVFFLWLLLIWLYLRNGVMIIPIAI